MSSKTHVFKASKINRSAILPESVNVRFKVTLSRSILLLPLCVGANIFVDINIFFSYVEVHSYLCTWQNNDSLSQFTVCQPKEDRRTCPAQCWQMFWYCCQHLLSLLGPLFHLKMMSVGIYDSAILFIYILYVQARYLSLSKSMR